VTTVSGLLKGQAVVGGRSGDVTAVIPATIGQVLDLHPVAGSIGRLAPDQIAVSQVEASDRGWHLGSRASLVLPDGTRAQVTVGAIYTSRNLAGDTLLPIKLWAPHALQLTASVLFVKLGPGGSGREGRGAQIADADRDQARSASRSALARRTWVIRSAARATSPAREIRLAHGHQNQHPPPGSGATST
jgi:hypothetical protein